MNHLILLLICILSIEFFVRFGFLRLLESIIAVSKKVIYILPKKNISDHWKEKVIPIYAFKIMKFSLQILLILLCILSFFILSGFFLNDFFKFIFSFLGILESMVFAFVYVFLRKLIIR